MLISVKDFSFPKNMSLQRSLLRLPVRFFSTPSICPTSLSILSTEALRNIETRWTKLPESEKAVIADALALVERGDWKKMTLEQKRACNSTYLHFSCCFSLFYRIWSI